MRSGYRSTGQAQAKCSIEDGGLKIDSWFCAVRATRLAVVGAVLLLAGCGFRLAGDRPLPPALQRVYIDTVEPYAVSEPPVEQALRSRLRRRGADIVAQPEAGVSTLRLTNLDEQRSVLSIGPDGKAVEFELTTTVDFVLVRDGKILVPSDRLNASRDYSFNAEQILAKEAEETRLQRYLQDELADLLLLRLEASLSRLVPEPTSANAGIAQ